jgi:hypothetical protein
MDLPDQDATLPEPGCPVVAPPGWKACLAVLGFYAVLVVVATYPMVLSFRSAIPSNVDPVQHLMVMRWYRTCLAEGCSPFVDTQIQYPFGAPIGNFPPMVLQTLGYLGLSTAIENDALCYNLLWFAGFLLAGMGTMLLSHRVVGDLPCSVFAGAAAMLGGPMMLHAHGHLELIYVGWFALFLVAWLRLVDRPGGRSMAMAAVAYSLMTLSSSYFAVLAVIPATWALILKAIGAARPSEWAWFRAQAISLVGFVALASPALLLTYSGQIWNVAHGLAMVRSKAEFASYGVPWYGYVVPTAFHPLERLFDVDVYDTFGHPVIECGSYLGVATLGLIAYAALRLVAFRGAIYWWSITLILIVLSFGDHIQVGRDRVTMPASWIHDHIFFFRFLRVPGRFNLLASVTAAVVAAAGLKDYVERWSRPAVRWAICGTLTAIAVADLSMIPFATKTIAPVPGVYGRLVEADPRATFLEVPVLPSFMPHPLTAATGYWQSSHRGRTSGGYSAHPNAPFDDQLAGESPFSYETMVHPACLQDPESATVGIVRGVRVLDSIWLYLTAHDLRYVVLHRSTDLLPEPLVGLAPLQRVLEPARIFEDESTVVFDRDRLPSPKVPVLVRSGGWRGRKVVATSNLASLWAYNPDPSRDLTFTLKACSIRGTRTVRLRSAGVELAAWNARAEIDETFTSPTFRLPAGLRTLTLEADGEESSGLRVSEVSLREAGVRSGDHLVR